MGLGIDTQRAGDLEKIHHLGGHGDRHLEIRRPGEGSWFFWGWGYTQRDGTWGRIMVLVRVGI